MNNYRTTFSKEEIQEALHKNEGMAESLIEDKNKWDSFLQKFQVFLKKAEKIPVLGSVLDDIVTMLDLVDSYMKKEYTKIPKATLISIVAALVYVISPIDIIPDAIPVIGYVDDVAVVMFVIKVCAQKDLNEYKKWKELKIIQCINEFSVSFIDILSDIIRDGYLAAMVMMQNNVVKLYISEQNNNENIECYVEELTIPTEMLEKIGVEGTTQIIDWLNGLVKNEKICWINGIEKGVTYEPDFRKVSDDFIIRQ